MFEQLPVFLLVQRCHRYPKGGSPATRRLQVPDFTPSLRPNCGVPVTTGRAVFTGDAAAIGPIGAETAVAEPDESLPVT